MTGWILLGMVTVAVMAAVGMNRWAKRRNAEVDDYFDRDFRDPPAMGGGPWPPGGGGGGVF